MEMNRQGGSRPPTTSLEHPRSLGFRGLAGFTVEALVFMGSSLNSGPFIVPFITVPYYIGDLKMGP